MPASSFPSWSRSKADGISPEFRIRSTEKPQETATVGFLLGTTALVAAGFFAGQAQAKFDVTVNGSWNVAYGYVNEDNHSFDVTDPTVSGNAAGGGSDHYKSQAINQDYEVHFRAQQTLDNGLIVGGRVELEGATNNGTTKNFSGSNGSDQIDERWMYFRGGFGEIRVGDEDDARKLKGYTAPDPTGFIFGVNSPNFTFNNAFPGEVTSTNTTTPNLENDSAKIIYFTPSFGGFQLAVSYAPDSTQDRFAEGTGGTNEPGQTTNNWSVGADYSGEFSGFTIAGGGGYSKGYGETSGAGDPSIWAAGLNVGIGGFTFGGSVAFSNSDDNADQTVYDVGVTYTWEAVTVGLGWSHGDYQNSANGGDDRLDQIQLASGYALGPGVTLAAMIGYFDYHGDNSGTEDNNGAQAAVGAAFNF
jgi:outer membrane protein OmpU